MIACPPGKRCTTAQLSAPDADCAAGRFCPRGTSGTGQACPAGFYCEARSGEPIMCPAGTFSNTQSLIQLSECTPCTAGYYCPFNGMTAVDTVNNKCEAGYECGSGSIHPRAKLCDLGYICPNSSAAAWQQQPCGNDATGEYMDERGGTVCKTCPYGYECSSSTGSIVVNDQKIRCTPNTQGPSYYCPAGVADRTACPNGSYTFQDRAQAVTDCLPCPKGFYCQPNPPDQYSKILPCLAGQYCPGSVFDPNLAQYNCPIGFYCPLGSNVPLPCKVGYYCATTKLSEPTGPCVAGYFCILKKDTTIALDLCMNRDINYCYVGAKNDQGITPLAGDTAKQCPQGHYCALGTFIPIACPIGTYNPSFGSTSSAACQNCDAGAYCIHRGQTTSGTPCAAGYFCSTGS